MPDGLNIGRLVRVQVNLAVQAAQRRGFGIGLAVGDSNVINGLERLRSYANIDEVAADFGVFAPEYFAAQLYFSQSPSPDTFFIGRWIRTATSGFLNGGALSIAEQNMSLWTPVIDGTFEIIIDGVVVDVTGANFSAETNLNGVASVINALPTMVGGTIAWDGTRFTFTSDTTGITSTIGFAVPEGTGTDISSMLKLDSANAQAPIAGYDVETPLEAVVALAAASNEWYAADFAASVMPSTSEYEQVAAFIEASQVARTLWITSTDVDMLDSAVTTDVASVMKALAFKRVFIQYSENAYASFSAMARLITTNFNANNSVITLMYKQEPSVVPTVLTSAQANTLQAKRANVFAAYDNDTAIIQYGVMSGNAYADEVIGIDWLQDAIENSVYNLLFQSKTKIPQTDAGQNQIVSTIAAVCDEGVNNGLIAPGQWNGDDFGQLQSGDFLSSGYYIYTPPMALQPQAIREQRIAPVIQVAVKLAGAIHEVDVIVDVNR